MKSEEIINKIKGAITDAAHIDLVKTPINFGFEDGKLIMEGMVENISIKRKALLIARDIKGDDNLIDRLKVKPASHMGEAEIIRHLEDAFDEDYALEGLSIDVSVTKDCIVHLDGTVHSLTHKKLAEVHAWWVPGSVDVINNLEVNPQEKDSDDEIKDTAKLIFERDKLVKDGNILIKVKDSVVTLTGLVKSTAAKDAAEDDLWYMSGVRNVINQLEVEK